MLVHFRRKINPLGCEKLQAIRLRRENILNTPSLLRIKARVGRVELRIGDGAQDIEPLIQRRVIRMDVEDRRGIEVPEVMVFGAADVGERFELGGDGDDIGGTGKRSQGERHGARELKRYT